MKRILPALGALTLTAACQTAMGEEAAVSEAPPTVVTMAAPTTPAGPTPAARGLAFAQKYCSRCHGVEAGAISPNPSSPPFEMVANAPGVTGESLNEWLHNSHDFPAEMYFVIADEHIDDLAAYMLTLHRKDYEPPIQ